VGGTIVIEDYAWLGPRVIVLPGVTIGRGCVIAAAAVVTRDAEPFGVYAGVPARRIGERAEDVDYKPGRNYIPII
jgi:acetyltransferase-like isoleucine patch superfamily enzyme